MANTTLITKGPRGSDFFQGGGFPDKTAVTGHGIAIYEDSGDQKINWDAHLPEDYKNNKDLIFTIYWFSVSVTTNAVKLDGRIELLAENGNPLTADNFGTLKTVTSTVSSTLAALKKAVLTFTQADMGSPAAGDVIRFNLVRDTTDAADTMVGDMAFLLWSAHQTV
jgi:hypothetical protein